MLRKLKKSLFIPILLILNVSYAQDSTFHVELIASIQAPEGFSFQSVTVEDMDWDGKLDIVYSAEGDEDHIIGIIDDGEHVYQSEPRYQTFPPWDFIQIHDFDNDGDRDIAIETVEWGTFEIYGGPDYSLIFEKDRVFDHSLVRAAGKYRDQDGNINTIFNYTTSKIAGGANWHTGYYCSQLISANPLTEEIEHISEICRCRTLCIINRQDSSGFDYFVGGVANWDHEYERNDYIHEEIWYYTMLFTSFQRDIHRPDSLVIYEFEILPGEDHYPASGWGPYFVLHSVIEDFDSDGNLEWIAPWQSMLNRDTTFIHIPVYDPIELELIHELVILTEGQPLAPSPPLICKGVKKVDVDRDGVWELLTFIRDEPLMLICPIDLEILSHSDEVIPFFGFTFEIGHFIGVGGRLQLLTMSPQGELLIYELPEEWTTYYSVETERPDFARSFCLNPAYPNPFNNSAKISYSLSENGFVNLALYNSEGRFMRSLLSEYQLSGGHDIMFQADGLPSGVYFIRLNYKDFSQIQRVIVLP